MLHVRWDSTDRHRVFTALALTGLAIGSMLAVFGLPPVDLHGPQHYLGVMGPLCGGTRGLRFALLGEWGQAWGYNPLSVILVVGAVGCLVRHLVGWCSGRWLTVHLRWGPVTIGLLVLAIIALGINQQLHADLLNPSS